MNRHLQDARTALDSFKKTGAEPNPEEFIRALYKALDAILKYLEELDHRSEAYNRVITVLPESTCCSAEHCARIKQSYTKNLSK